MVPMNYHLGSNRGKDLAAFRVLYPFVVAPCPELRVSRCHILNQLVPYSVSILCSASAVMEHINHTMATVCSCCSTVHIPKRKEGGVRRMGPAASRASDVEGGNDASPRYSESSHAMAQHSRVARIKTVNDVISPGAPGLAQSCSAEHLTIITEPTAVTIRTSSV